MTTETGETNRRDFLVVAGNAFAAVGAAAAMWPFISQMNPDASAQALASTEFDLTPVKEGQAITILWRGKPVFIRNRTKDESAKAQAPTMRRYPKMPARATSGCPTTTAQTTRTASRLATSSGW